MDKQKITLFALAGVGGIVLIALAVFLYLSLSNMGEAHQKRERANRELDGYYKRPVFPNKTNIDQYQADAQNAGEWSERVLETIQKGAISVPDESSTGFKTRLQNQARLLANINDGKAVKPGLTFGFDYYLGSTDAMPQGDNIPRLSRQLFIIDQLSRQLFAAGITQLTAVSREEFDRAGGAAASTTDENTSGRRRRGTAGTTSTVSTTTEALPEVLQGVLSKESFTFEFETGYPALATVLNELIKLDLFVVITDVRVARSKSVEMLAEERQKRLSALDERKQRTAAEAATDDLLGKRPQDRIVTNPENDPPLKVTLKVDVYSVQEVEEGE